MDKKPDNQETQSQFFKTDKGKTRSNAIEIPSVSLPKGGGAIKGIDEKFTVNAVNGTAALSLPLPFSPARGAAPAVSLVYNSGAGNGVFGLGWVLGLSSSRRKTDRKLPRYQDSIDSDTFLFSDAEDLVPEFRKEPDGSFSVDSNGNYIIREEDSADGLFTIRFYKPRIEGLFARIERWTGKTSPEMKWRVISRENRTTLLGWSSASRIADPDDESRIFEWLPEFVFDDKGNCSHYLYKKEDDTGFDPMLLHNRNRFKNGKITYTNLYLEKILYGNKTPYKKFNDPFPSEASYFFQTVLDYGEYDQNPPYGRTGSWNFRQDAFSQYKAGFEIRTTRLCRRVLLFHYFNELPGGFAMVKSLDLTFDTTQAEGFSFLKSASLKGYIKQGDGSYTNKSYPAEEFDYQKLAWNSEVKSISSSDMEGFSEGTDEGQYQFTDLFNEGLAGMLSEQDRGWYYRHNLGGGQFAPAVPVAAKPSFAGLGRQLQLVDLDVDGGKQLVNYGSEPRGYFELDDEEEEWQPFRAFRNLPNIDFRDPNTRLLDINGDGRPDILITDDLLFTCYESAGREGFDGAYTTAGFLDEEAGPKILFSDPLQTIFLADMSGDGMTDIVRIRNADICYWPNLGYGRFGAKVAMDGAPVFDNPDAFNPAFIRLADIDGSGTSDIIYLGHDRFSCWLNLNGNTFAGSPFEIEAFPEMHNRANVTVSDLLGNGVACIVSRSDLPKDVGAPLKYIDLMDGKKPHLMVSYKNNLGKEVYLEYKPSTYYYLQDKLSGNPWITKLHFPVHCVASTETRDVISGSRFVNSYSYHHGYFDHPEREFRGFGRVEQLDGEHYDNWVKGGGSNVVSRELHQDPVLTKSWFHTGAFLSLDNILGQFGHEYWYEVMNRLGYGVVNHEPALPDAKITVAEGLPAALLDRLTGQEWQEALRACKGMALRTEVFSKDAPLTGASAEQIKKELTPHVVTSGNCIIELVQPRGQNQFAVFTVRTSEPGGPPDCPQSEHQAG
jgi:hypothetical protein